MDVLCGEVNPLSPQTKVRKGGNVCSVGEERRCRSWCWAVMALAMLLVLVIQMKNDGEAVAGGK